MKFKIIEDVMDIAKRIHEKTNHVFISDRYLDEVAHTMVKNPIRKELKTKNINNIISGNDDAKADILKELVCDSVNYCFWIGTSDIRPNGSSSNKMRDLLERSFNAHAALTSIGNFEIQLRNFYGAMLRNRFPVMEKRLVHLNALVRRDYFLPATSRRVYKGDPVAFQIVQMIAERRDFERVFDFLITNIDGFGDDPFLKRAILFFLQLNRIFGIYADDIKDLPIPADYQVPKMMRHLKILYYSDQISFMISNNVHFQENGPEEMAIRSATIIAAKKLGSLTGMSPSEVDGWFFLQRKKCFDPFALCVTSNY
jgi:hypothetical protein